MGAVFTGLQPIVPALRPLCLAHAAVSKPAGGHRVDRSAWSHLADDQIPVLHNADSILVVCHTPRGQNRHGISVGLVLFARRGALELVVDASRRSETFVGCGGQFVSEALVVNNLLVNLSLPCVVQAV